MTKLVIDASIAIKWVVEEDGTADALALRRRAQLIAPDLLIPECANILWKKVQRTELSPKEASLAARLLQGAEIELFPMRSLLEMATQLSIELHHPAYDCIYISLAAENNCRFVTADDRLLRALHQRRERWLRSRAISLTEAAKL